VVVGSRYIGARRFLDERVLGAVLRDIRGASPHQHSETGRLLGLIRHRVFVSFFGFYLRGFVTHSDGVSPTDV
jgi:hypothetical protein